MGMLQLIVRDQINARPFEHQLILQWQEGVPLTPRTLITERVRIEWEARTADVAARERPLPLIDIARLPPEYERGRSCAPHPTMTLESVTAMALEGFARNAFFLIIDGRQVTDLDALIALRPASAVTFVRLVPLKGG